MDKRDRLKHFQILSLNAEQSQTAAASLQQEQSGDREEAVSSPETAGHGGQDADGLKLEAPYFK